jgi:hypothetical protein
MRECQYLKLEFCATAGWTNPKECPPSQHNFESAASVRREELLSMAAPVGSAEYLRARPLKPRDFFGSTGPAGHLIER